MAKYYYNNDDSLDYDYNTGIEDYNVDSSESESMLVQPTAQPQQEQIQQGPQYSVRNDVDIQKLLKDKINGAYMTDHWPELIVLIVIAVALLAGIYLGERFYKK